MRRPVENLATVDFESEKIEDRPHYPPKPVGVALRLPGMKPRYYAWGHPTKNNCSKGDVARVLKDVWKRYSLLFQNAAFDLDVAEVHFGLRLPDWDRIHDTLYLLFLKNPHALSLSLKPSAEHYLNMPPEERDAVYDWLVEHGIVKANQKDAGAYISKAPGDIVGRYAIGDVVRTDGLFDLLLPDIERQGMLPAYNRERELMPVLLRNEREGFRADVRAMERDLNVYEAAQAHADNYLRKRLKSPDLNVDADADVARALKDTGIVTEWTKTPTGRDSLSKKFLTPDKFKDKKVASALGYRNRLGTVLSNNLRPWLAMCRSPEGGGRFYTSWNQVRATHGEESSGARTGRLSASRVMNVSKDFYDKNDGYIHPDFLSTGWTSGRKFGAAFPALPLVRKYILPDDPGSLFCHRDYDQQEFRILAHFEGDRICRGYNEDPTMDFHEFMRQQVALLLGIEMERRPIKQLNFGVLYGMGLDTIAARMGTDRKTAEKLKNAQRQAIPELRNMSMEFKRRSAAKQPIRTWGGRLYFCEEPRLVKGRLWTFEYKLLNYLIQASAADCTKQAIIDYSKARKHGRFLVTVHDEINLSVPKEHVKSELLILRDVMANVRDAEGLPFAVPMRSSAKAGRSWGELSKVKEA